MLKIYLHVLNVSFCTFVYSQSWVSVSVKKMTVFGLDPILVMMFMGRNLGVRDVFNFYHSYLCARK